MALLDVTDILSDPDFTDTITVTATTRAIGADGRAVDTVEDPVTVVAPVLPVPQRLILQSDGALRDGAITIFSTYSISGGFKTDDGASRQADVIGWHGRTYVVVSVEDYTAFGAGWFRVLANLAQINPSA